MSDESPHREQYLEPRVELDDGRLDRYLHRYERFRQARESLELQKTAYQESLNEDVGSADGLPKALVSLAQWRTVRQEADLDVSWRQQTEQEISRLTTRQKRLEVLEQRVLRQLVNHGMPVGIYVELLSSALGGTGESVILLKNKGRVAHEKTDAPEPCYTLDRVLTEAIDKAPPKATHSTIKEISKEIESYRSGSPAEKLLVWASPVSVLALYGFVLLASWGVLAAGVDTLALLNATTVDLGTWTPVDAVFREILAGPMGGMVPPDPDPNSPSTVIQAMTTIILLWGFFVLAPALWFIGALLKLLVLPFTAAKHLHDTHRLYGPTSTRYEMEKHVGPNK